MNEPHVVILGGGPAGVGAAYYLRKQGRAAVTLLERQAVVGGNAGSFELAGLRVDYGSHRLHSACDPAILSDIRSLLDGELLTRPRQGRIRLRNRWLQFPLKPVDLVLRLDRGFAAGAALDMVRRQLPGGPPTGDTFASVLRANLGPTICEHFYFPYARKIWGRQPDELSAIQARKRVTAGSFSRLLRRVFRPPGSGQFYYPRNGYGQISEAFADAAVRMGAELLLGWSATGLRVGADGRWTVTTTRADESREIVADHVWSTIPTPLLARMVTPAAPPEVEEAARGISYRAMVLVYITLDVDRFTSTDAHYFPEESVAFTRVSEPKNYSARTDPEGRTVLCAELPTDIDDALWRMSDEELSAKVALDLARVGLPLTSPPLGVHVRRLRQAYPIYLKGYEVPFGVLDRWAESLPGVLIYGRQGLFAHDNTHHALYMAKAAVDCLSARGFDADRWARYREIFKTHVVED